MSAPAAISNLIGRWKGINHLWLSPQDPVRLSESVAEVKTIAKNQFIEIHYTWSENNKPQEGKLILGQVTDSIIVKAVWFDTWHLVEDFMVCEGAIEANNVIRIKGYYAAPHDQDWGWEITIKPKGRDKFRFVMHNISPEDDRMLAVEVNYSRQ